jgi:PiT family inorganic phosphate transporter
MEILILVIVLGLIFDYTNGFHDAANVVSTVIATRVLTPVAAIVMAAVLNFIGATQISGVAETIATGLIDSEHTTQIVVLCSVFAAIIWNLATWAYGIPSSSSYALVGGLIGAAFAYNGFASIFWNGVLWKVIIPMFASPIIGFSLGAILMKVLLFYFRKDPEKANKKYFQHLQIGSACIVALSHGLNDAQKSMGLITLGLFSAGAIKAPHIPFWVIISCAVVMGLGTASGGFRIIHTMAYSITKITPIQGFAAETSASIVILIASFLGMPVSSTHVITGGITGVGAAKSLNAVQWNVPRRLILAWLVTLPGSALISWCSYQFFSLI